MSLNTARGTLVVAGAGGSPAQTIVFQYNPGNLRRTLVPQLLGGDNPSRSQPLLYTAPPTETIELQLEIDALDQDTKSGVGSSGLGILPQLCALEIVLYPPTSKQVALATAMSAGTLEVGVVAAPQLLLNWGSNRSAPVQITELSVTEDAFDPSLNPVRATVQLKLRVLSTADVDPGDPNYSSYLAYQGTKETFARQGYSQGHSQ